jgi:hypothetical protein
MMKHATDVIDKVSNGVKEILKNKSYDDLIK